MHDFGENLLLVGMTFFKRHVVYWITVYNPETSFLQELPLLYLKGGSIVPTAPVVQSVEDAKPTDTITLLVALDENGKFIL